MIAKRRNLNIEAGTTYRRVMRFWSDRERTVPVDISSWTFAAWITRGTFKIEFAFEITDGPNGEAVMALEPEQTIDVLPAEYVWDMLIDTGNDVKKPIKGTATIHPTGTRLPTDE